MLHMQGFLMEEKEEADNVCGGLFKLESLICLLHAVSQDHFCEATPSLVIHIHGLHVLFHCLLQHQYQLESPDQRQKVPIVALRIWLYIATCDSSICVRAALVGPA